jgi:hypothetical protein
VSSFGSFRVVAISDIQRMTSSGKLRVPPGSYKQDPCLRLISVLWFTSLGSFRPYGCSQWCPRGPRAFLIAGGFVHAFLFICMCVLIPLHQFVDTCLKLHTILSVKKYNTAIDTCECNPKLKGRGHNFNINIADIGKRNMADTSNISRNLLHS